MGILIQKKFIVYLKLKPNWHSVFYLAISLQTLEYMGCERWLLRREPEHESIQRRRYEYTAAASKLQLQSLNDSGSSAQNGVNETCFMAHLKIKGGNVNTCHTEGMQ